MKISCTLVVVLASVCLAEPPADRILPPRQGHTAPGTFYGAPSAPPNQYEAPSAPLYLYEPPTNTYLPTLHESSGRYGKDQNKPDDYHFGYTVKGEKSGNDFGHKETKQGKVTKGEYFVLLPDGRKQIVTYTADENGYRAKIRYEETHKG